MDKSRGSSIKAASTGKCNRDGSVELGSDMPYEAQLQEKLEAEKGASEG